MPEQQEGPSEPSRNPSTAKVRQQRSANMDGKISFGDGRSRRQYVPEDIFLEERGGPSMWISTHMVHRRMETRIDQSNINI